MRDESHVIAVDQTVLTESGLSRVSRVDRYGVQLVHVLGGEEWVPWTALGDSAPLGSDDASVVTEALRPAWDGLDEKAQEEALGRLEVVLEVRTGFRYGHRELALPGEPFTPFGDEYGASLNARCVRMARLLGHEKDTNRELQRRLHRGGRTAGGVSWNTVNNWIRAWERDGLLGLVDGRRRRPMGNVERVSSDFNSLATEIVTGLDGDYSTVNQREVLRRIRVRLREAGIPEIDSQKQQERHVSWLMRSAGRTTRSQRSTKLRQASGHSHYPAMLPGQVVCVDVTRSDVMTVDMRTGKAMSVEVITAIDLATRVILAMRVVPTSADAQDAMLLLYDVMRPFSQLVEGTTISDWAWAGVPDQLDLSALTGGDESAIGAALQRNTAPQLQGLHRVPGVLPAAIRSDHGSIFVSAVFRELLQRFRIDLMLSRGKRPIDNPMIERYHETLQRGFQQLPGYKGRNVSERGDRVGKPRAHDHEPLLTPAELQRYLRRWVVLDYHRSRHSGLTLSGAPDIDLTPLEMTDALLEVTGRIHVAQRPDLLYDFLPVRWGTVRHAGVEFHDLTYDCAALDEFRANQVGAFRAEDRAMPFFYDPHDATRVWFRRPGSREVVMVPWRGSYMTDVPMTAAVLAHVKAEVVAKRGSRRLLKDEAERRIIDELGTLMVGITPKAWHKRLASADRRVELSRADHETAAEARRISVLTGASLPDAPAGVGAPSPDGPSIFDDAWPDLRDL